MATRKKTSATRGNPSPEITRAISGQHTPEGAGIALAGQVTGLDKATVLRFARFWERDLMHRAKHPADWESFWQAYRKESLIQTGSLSRSNPALPKTAKQAIASHPHYGAQDFQKWAEDLMRSAVQLSGRRAAETRKLANVMAGAAALKRQNPACRSNPQYRIEVIGADGTWSVYTTTGHAKAWEMERQFKAEGAREVKLAPVPPVGKKKARKNPEAEAVALYEDFHGQPSDSVLEIKTPIHTHDWAAELGKLVELEIEAGRSGRGKLEVIPISFRESGILVTGAEGGNQIMFDGGDQSLDLGDLKSALGIATRTERIVVGRVFAISYHTSKYHLQDGQGPGVYYHVFGEKTSVRPTLVYDVRSQLIEFVGGDYKIVGVGIVG